jgi:hypothetical protein
MIENLTCGGEVSIRRSLARVVFPLPLSPMSAYVSPEWILILTSLTA